VKKCLVGAVALLACACAAQQERYVYPLRETSTKPAPPAWSKVRVIEASSVGASPVATSVPPAEALGRTLARRIGEDGQRPFSLYIENVQALDRVDNQGAGFGLGAEFVLKNDKGAEKRLRLEHTVNTFELGRKALDRLYGHAVDELSERILHHKDALAFIGSEQIAWRDPLLEEKVEPGPVMPVTSGANGVEATGRNLWGDVDRAGFFVGNILLGSSPGAFFFTQQRSGTAPAGVGYRYGYGVGGLKVEDSVAFMFMFMGGFELGLLSTIHTDQGYVDRPGLSLLLVPQVTGINILVPGDTFTQIISTTFGGSIELDLPLTSFLGVTGSVFAGGAIAAITAGSFSQSVGPTFAWFPTGDVYIQTPSSRFSLGLAFQALSDPEAILENPQIVFTYQSRVGRGIAYEKQDLKAFDYGIASDVDVLSSPRSAFVDPDTKKALWTPEPGTGPTKIALAPPPAAPPAGAAPVAVVPAVPSTPAPFAPPTLPTAPAVVPVIAPLAPQQPPTPAPAAKKPSRWVVLEPELTGFEAVDARIVELITMQAIGERGVSTVSKDDLRATLGTLGLTKVEDKAIADVGGALGATHVFRVLLTKDGDAVSFELRCHAVEGAAVTSLNGKTSSVSMLRVLREKTKEIGEP
jgi:hypothetical protein